MCSMNDVKVYSAPHCKACDIAKRYLRENGVQYEEIDVSEDADACEELLKLTGSLQLPVIQRGEGFVIGYSRRRIDELLAEPCDTAT